MSVFAAGRAGGKDGRAKAPKERKKKPDELLGSVVRETAIPAALELLRANTPFGFPSDTAWAILMLQADAVGGLSKRHGRDEAKGSIIELIESDQIRTVATADMLAEEVFGIIPTAETLSRMEEYALLTSAEYSWAVVWQEGQELRIDMVARADFGQACRISAGTENLKNVVGAQAWKKHSGEDELAVDGSNAVRQEEVSRSPDAGDPLFDESPPDGELEFDTGDEEDAPVFSDVVDEGASESFDEGKPGFAEAGRPAADGEPLAEDEPDEELNEGEGAYDDVLIADQDQVRRSLARRFLSEDLGLEITLDEFAASFGIGAPVVQIEIPAGTSDWLGDQIAQMTRQANAELTRLHDAGEAELKAQYVSLMSLHAEQVIREVATDRAGGVYKELIECAEAEHEQRLAQKEEKTRKRRKEIVAEFEESAAKASQQAALQAEIQYKERNKARAQREQVDAIAAIESDIENIHSHSQQEILRLRRKDAERRMFVGQTRIFEVIGERQRENLEAERGLLEAWTAKIQRVVDENRKTDISRAEVLAEEQSRTDRVIALEREYEAVVERMRAEQAERMSRMGDELERQRQDAVKQLRAHDEEWQHSLNLEKAKTDSESRRSSDLLAQMAIVEQSTEKKYEDRLFSLKRQNDSLIGALKSSDAIQSRSNKTLTLLVITLSLVMITAGFIVGAIAA